MKKSFVFACIVSVMSTLSFGALQVKYAEGTNPEWKEILDRNYLCEEIEGWAAEICRLYTGTTEAVDDEVLYLSLYSGDGVAGTHGTTIFLNMKWVEGWLESDPTLTDVRGALIHEIAHAVQGCLSRYLTKQAGADREVQLDYTILIWPDGKEGASKEEHLTEGLAEWVRRYRFAPPKAVWNTENEFAVKDGYVFKEYGKAAGLLEYLTRAYGQGIIKDILYYCSTNRGYKVDTMWPALTGKSFTELLEMRNAELKERLSIEDKVVSVARWIGPGDGSLSDAKNWECANSIGFPVDDAVPSRSSAVVAWGATVPSIPEGTQLSCASFTVKRWITLDRDIDWRGLSQVLLDDGATIRTSGHRLAAPSLIGRTMRLYGHLAYDSLKLDGDLILCGGSVLEIPSSGNAEISGRLCLQDKTPVFIRFADSGLAAGEYLVLTAKGGLPDDLSTLRIAGLSGRKRCVFEKRENNLYAVVSEADSKDFSFWTGAARDGRFPQKATGLMGSNLQLSAMRRLFFPKALGMAWSWRMI